MATETYTPEIFNQARLAVADFDGTAAETFEPAPNGIGVNEAYERVVEEQFGLNSLTQYKKEGGHLNRTPAEIVSSLRPNLSVEDLERETRDFIGLKLEILLSQIGLSLGDGKKWPRPVEGFTDFWNLAQEAKNNGRLIDTAIVSAGHVSFIRKTFTMWDLPEPDILVTEETIRGLSSPLPPERLAKPAPLQMMLVLMQWGYRYGLNRLFNESDKMRAVYIGDDASKDRDFAQGMGVDFIYMDPKNSVESWRQYGIRLGLGAVSLTKSVSYDPEQ